MWKNPKVIQDILCPLIVVSLRDSDSRTPFLTIDSPWTEAHGLLSDLYENVRAQTSREAMERVLRRETASIAKQLSEKKNWQLIADLGRLTQLLQSIATQDQRGFCLGVTHLLHCLISSETKFLIGTRFGKATWIPWKPLRSPTTEFTFARAIGPDIEYIGSEDLELVEDADQWPMAESGQYRSLPAIPNCWQKVAILLEDSYYNQQYVPHPDGSYVRLQGVSGLESVIIKAKRGLYDRNYVDIMAVYNFSRGKTLVVIDGSMAMQQEDDLRRRVALKRPDFLVWLTALIYHDLVTAKEVVRSSRSAAESTTSIARTEKPEHIPEIRWTYIPRRHKKEVREVRRPATTPRSMSAHRVTGHKRRAKMTDRQRCLIQDFEQETGIDILRWIPEGYTFVRPHVVPKEDSEHLQSLPRFIRTRIQQELQALLLKD